MNLREDYESFLRKIGKPGLDADDFLRWLERKLTEAQAETVERCIESLIEEGADEDCRYIYKIRAISPDPNFLARKMAEERLRTLRDWPELCNGDTDVPVRHAKLCKYHREIARLERDLATLGEGK